MKVSIEYTGDVAALLAIEVLQADYENLVKEQLESYRKRVELPGFRKGKAPFGLVEKKYGLGAKVDEINKLVGSELVKYIEENKLAVLGDPMPSDKTEAYDFATAKDFIFYFDLALAPKFELSLGKEDTLDYYNIVPTEKMIDDQIQSLRESMGSVEEVDTIEDKDVVGGLLVELDGDQPKEGGLVRENALLMPSFLKNEDIRNEFLGKPKNTVIVFTPSDAMDNNAAELSSFLSVEKEAVAEYIGKQFSFEVDSIRRRFPAELNEDLYREVFGEDTDIKDEAGLRERMKQDLASYFKSSSDYKFSTDLDKLLLEKEGDLQFADDILKRWLIARNKIEGQEALERLDAEYPELIRGLRLQLARNKVLEELGVPRVTREEVEAEARLEVRRQFAQYGMQQIEDSMLTSYVNQYLSNENAYNRIAEQAANNKLVEAAKEAVTLVEKTVDADEFAALMEEASQN